jgi:large subunit ribosomal protein L13
MKTYVTKADTINKNWHLIDASDKILGRMSTSVAKLLMGKDKTYFTPALDCGDYVVVINAEKIKVTGAKKSAKIYRHHTGYPGGFRELTFEKVQAKNPARIIAESVKGMLPKNKLRDLRLKRLKVFAGPEHPYADKFSNK